MDRSRPDSPGAQRGRTDRKRTDICAGADAVARQTKRGVAGPAEGNKEREACDDVGVGQRAADVSEHSSTGQPHALGVRPS